VNYYERHLGDYARDTGHLSMLEHGAYSLLLDRYYITERGIPADQAHRIARARSQDERDAVDAVLQEFFTLIDGIWVQARAVGEIALAQKKIDAARQNGKLGGRPRKGIPSAPEPTVEANTNQNETRQKPSGLSLGYENETQTKALQTPDSKHQTPDTKERKPPASPWLTVDDLTADGLSQETAEAFIAHRRAKKAKLTALAWKGFTNEVAKAAGWTNEAAALKAIARNWTSFEASWVADASRRPNSRPQETFRERDDRLAAERMYEATGGHLGRAPASMNEQPLQEIFDVTPISLGR